MKSPLFDPNAIKTDYTTPKMTRSLSKEQLRYEAHSPFMTLLEMSVGPLIYMLGIAIHDAIDLLLISKAFTETEVTIVGFATTIRYLCMSVAIYFSQACVAKTSALIGADRFSFAAQVTADLYRLAFVSSIIIPVIFYFISDPLLRFMGCTPAMSKEACSYLIPILCLMPLISTFQLSCGTLQSEGRSILSGLMQLTAFALNCGVFGPALLFGLKIPFKYAGFSFAISQALPGIVLSLLIFSGKLNDYIKWGNLVKKPIKETYDSLKIASPYILNVIAGVFPPLILINLMMNAASKQGITQYCGPVYSIFLKLQPLVNCFSISFGQGMLGTGSYAHGSGNDNRLLHIYYSTFGLTLIFQLVLLPIIVFFPRYVAKIWLRDSKSLDLSVKMLPIPFYTNWTTAINESVTALLQCLSYSKTAISPSLTRGAFYIIYSFAIYYLTNKDDCVKMMYVYCANDLTILLLDLIIWIKPIRKLTRKKPNTDSMASV
ncbi:hypothetical protein TVAG_150700 [Trichomonas vaginalis G3]|uniref:MatE family protein n=1 Tax=Trichomonas vaginalis (strain ATCC PRA-98 / G3) TaxID=412133 RepID=A2DRX2_TRIV3|nr:multidrug resistance protein YPNP-related family [Trichomonas vaginalis G3]EAY16919.1 hypothetical protein TVAG_150700 [Trichomonas vaginalis G3]KAI5489095.1 multidrug resistance protein YPNP-related family [Trichomonas vaginalis G3]|eukprot:XP_001329142.1 hypothetical protein [Trichomonas vaginalis G3]